MGFQRAPKVEIPPFSSFSLSRLQFCWSCEIPGVSAHTTLHDFFKCFSPEVFHTFPWPDCCFGASKWAEDSIQSGLRLFYWNGQQVGRCLNVFREQGLYLCSLLKRFSSVLSPIKCVLVAKSHYLFWGCWRGWSGECHYLLPSEKWLFIPPRYVCWMFLGLVLGFFFFFFFKCW